MTWSDEGYILGVNIYGENSSIISIFSKDHGHHKGIIYGGTSSKLKKLIHIGNKIKDRKSTRLNSSHMSESRMPSSA